MIISIDTEKAFDKIQSPPFRVKNKQNPQQTRNRRELNLIPDKYL